MKKFTCILLGLLMLFTLVGCSTHPEKAKWDGYDEMAFMKFLKKGLQNMHEDQFPDEASPSISVIYEEGWPGAEDLHISELSEGCSAYTYIADIYFDDGNYIRLSFFMELDEDLRVRGACSEELNWTTNLSASEAREQLKLLKEYMG